jgi:TPR repeat protein
MSDFVDQLKILLAPYAPIADDKELKEVRRACKADNVEAIQRLAVCSALGHGLSVNNSRTTKLLKRGDQLKSGLASYLLGLGFVKKQLSIQSWQQWRSRGFEREAEEAFRRAIRRGVRAATIDLGVLLTRVGAGAQGRRLLHRAAQEGEGRAETEIGRLEAGLKARKWFSRAMARGMGDANVELGRLYFAGSDQIIANRSEAIKLWSEVAERNWEAALLLSQAIANDLDDESLARAEQALRSARTQVLTELAYEAFGVFDRFVPEKNLLVTGVVSFIDERLASVQALRGDPDACDRFGARLFAAGDAACVAFIQSAADAGIVRSRYQFALCLKDGFGVPQDEQRAFSIFERLAMEGDAASAGVVGQMLSDGIGVRQNQRRGRWWLLQGARRNDLAALERLYAIDSADLRGTVFLWLRKIVARLPDFREAPLDPSGFNSEDSQERRRTANRYAFHFLRLYFGVSLGEGAEELFLRRRDKSRAVAHALLDSFPEAGNWGDEFVDLVCRHRWARGIVRPLSDISRNASATIPFLRFAECLSYDDGYNPVWVSNDQTRLRAQEFIRVVFTNLLRNDFEPPSLDLSAYGAFLEEVDAGLPEIIGDHATQSEAWEKYWQPGLVVALYGLYSAEPGSRLRERAPMLLEMAAPFSVHATCLLAWHLNGGVAGADRVRARKLFEAVVSWSDEPGTGDQTDRGSPRVLLGSRKYRETAIDPALDAKLQGWAQARLADFRVEEVRERTTQEMLSYLTHTLKNRLAAGPEQARQVMRTLGSGLYDGKPREYTALLNVGKMYATFLFAQHLVSTFKSYIADPAQLRENWENDSRGDADVGSVAANALLETLSQVVFLSDYQSILEDLIPAERTMRDVRKSFTDEIVPLQVANAEDAGPLYAWIRTNLPTVHFDLAEIPAQHFAPYGTRYAFLFSCLSELLSNALRNVAKGGEVRVSWVRVPDGHLLEVSNSRGADRGASRMAGSGRGVDFVRKTAEVLGARLETDFDNDPAVARIVMDQELWVEVTE